MTRAIAGRWTVEGGATGDLPTQRLGIGQGWAPVFGLVPGVVLGAFVAGAMTGELALEGFQGDGSMRRHIVGAVLTGFGVMPAGGCAVGAGLSVAAEFKPTAVATLAAMWDAAAPTDRPAEPQPAYGPLDPPTPTVGKDRSGPLKTDNGAAEHGPALACRADAGRESQLHSLLPTVNPSLRPGRQIIRAAHRHVVARAG